MLRSGRSMSTASHGQDGGPHRHEAGSLAGKPEVRRSKQRGLARPAKEAVARVAVTADQRIVAIARVTANLDADDCSQFAEPSFPESLVRNTGGTGHAGQTVASGQTACRGAPSRSKTEDREGSALDSGPRHPGQHGTGFHDPTQVGPSMVFALDIHQSPIARRKQ